MISIMSSQKKSPNPNNRKRQRSQQRQRALTPARAPRRTGVPPSLISKICGLTDPFCSHAIGAKYPDDSSVRSLPYFHHFRQTLNSDVNGQGALLFMPQWDYYTFTEKATGTFPSVATWNGFASAAPIANASQYRIVSAGFRIRNVTAPLNSSGMVHIRLWPSEKGGEYAGIDLTSYYNTKSLDVALQDCKDVCITVPHTSQMPQAFYPITRDSATVGNWQSSGFTPCTIYVSGVPASSAVLDVETFIHYELQFDATSGLAAASTPPPPANSMLTNAANRVTSVMPGIFQHGVERFGRLIADKAVKTVALYLGGPEALAASFATAAIVD